MRWRQHSSSFNPIDAYRNARARDTGPSIALLGFVLAVIAGALELKWGSLAVFFGDFILAVGCAISSVYSKILFRKNPEAEFSWMPGWFSLCFFGFPLIYISGGIASPYLTVYIAVLFVSGVTGQTKISAPWIGAFCAFNFVFWLLLSDFTHFIPPPLHYPVFVHVAKEAFLLLGLMVCIFTLLKTEAKMSEDAHRKQLALHEAETHLTQTAKMAEIGDLLAGTAHELAQPIQVISASASILNRMVEKNNNDPTILVPIYQRLAEASTRMVHLLEQLRNFARKDPFQSKTFDLRESIHAVDLLVRNDLAMKHVHFEARMPDSSVVIDGDSLRIQQIVLNLVNNARDSAVKTSEESPRISLSLSKRDGWARILIENNGPGISLANQRKIFNPYFTTKERGEGTGLGLSICAQLVEQHRGKIYFSSENEKTVFVVDVPCGKSQIADARPGLVVTHKNLISRANRITPKA